MKKPSLPSSPLPQLPVSPNGGPMHLEATVEKPRQKRVWRKWSARERTALALLAIALLAVPLILSFLGTWGFFDPDEGRYAEIPREMLAMADWVTPHLNSVDYFEKPPLLYWLVACSYSIFGLHEWAARLVPAISALLGLYLAYGLGRRMFSERAGVLGAVVLATCVFWPAMAHELVIDMLLAVVLFAALTFWWLGHTDSGPRRTWYFLAFWVSLALGVLSKGPVAVVIVGVSIGLYMALCGQWSALRPMQWLAGVPLFLLITAPWFVLVAQRNPGFNHFFWYGQNVGRFLGIGKNREHVKGFFYFFELLPALLFPWTVFLPAAILAARGRLWPARSPRRRAAVYLLCSIVFITLFFSASSSKLVTYILPIFPMAAVLMGAYFDDVLKRRGKSWTPPLANGAIALAVINAVGAIAIFVLGRKYLVQAEALDGGVVVTAGLLFLVWSFNLLVAVARRQVVLLLAVVVGGMVLVGTSLMLVVGMVAPNHYSQSLMQQIEPGLRQGGDIVIYGTYTQSVGFYARRRVMLIGEPGELQFGHDQLSPAERAIWFPAGGVDTLRRLMQRATPLYCLVPDHDTAQTLLPQLGPGVREIIYNERRSIIGNRAAAHATPPQGNLLAYVEQMP